MSRGIVIFAINNNSINYVQLAIICASFIRKNMQPTNICIITDEGSKNYFENSNNYLLSKIFNDVIILPNQDEKFINKRQYRDTRYYSINDSFKNEARYSAYYLSPYDETLLIDCDYLILNDSLSHVWGSVSDIMINHKAIGLLHNQLPISEQRLNPYGIKMYWATIIYFKKNEYSKILFDLVEHIKDNWDFYKLSYDFPGTMFRNDYAFSIAIHILSGFDDSGNYVKSLPDDTILSALDTDQFYEIYSPTQLGFFVNDVKDTWKFYCSKIKNCNVHCMNKISLLNNTSKILKVLND